MRPPSPRSGLTDSFRPDCSLALVVPILNEASKCLRRVPLDGPALSADGSPTSSARPGENVWSPKDPLAVAFDARSAWAPKP